jgi:4-hydroxy-tetrahydrodipicolinate synthase
MSELAKAAMDAGAGVMVAPPTNLRTDAEILDYFQSAAENLGAYRRSNIAISPDVDF